MQLIDWAYLWPWPQIAWLYLQLAWLYLKLFYYETKPMHATLVQFGWTVYFIHKYHSTLRKLRKLEAAKASQDRVFDSLLQAIFELRRKRRATDGTLLESSRTF